MNTRAIRPAPLSRGSFEAEAWWLGYLEHISRQGIRRQALVWHRHWVERLLERYPGTKSTQLCAVDVEEHLKVIGRQWMPLEVRGQILEALQRFGGFIQADWAASIPWVDWRRAWLSDASVAPGCLRRPCAVVSGAGLTEARSQQGRGSTSADRLSENLVFIHQGTLPADATMR